MDTENREHLQFVVNHDYDYARKILKHYFHLLRKRTDLPYDPDNDAELDGMIDAIREAVEYQIQRALLEYKQDSE